MGGKFIDPRATPDPAVLYRRKGGAGQKTDSNLDMAMSRMYSSCFITTLIISESLCLIFLRMMTTLT
jgi:hypothetical protein